MNFEDWIEPWIGNWMLLSWVSGSSCPDVNRRNEKRPLVKQPIRRRYESSNVEAKRKSIEELFSVSQGTTRRQTNRTQRRGNSEKRTIGMEVSVGFLED
jgi:hypothetical protein